MAAQPDTITDGGTDVYPRRYRHHHYRRCCLTRSTSATPAAGKHTDLMGRGERRSAGRICRTERLSAN